MSGSAAHDFFYSLQSRGMKLGLENMRRLDSLLGSPHRAFRSIHIAGTNGKGSVAAMLEALLRAEGIHTGLFTSPHLVRFHERVRIDGTPIADPALTASTARVQQVVAALQEEGVEPTFFEAVTAMAFDAMREAQVEIAVIETGLGGRLDSTNIVDPECCILTPIGRDHMEYLGGTLREIAAEKCGILKPGVPAVIHPGQPPEALEVIRATAAERGVALHEVPEPADIHHDSTAWRTTCVSDGTPLTTNLFGWNQAGNAATAWTAYRLLRNGGATPAALTHVHWPGRFQRVTSHSLGVIDGAHNAPAVRETLRNWNAAAPAAPARILFGCMSDKHPDEWVRLLDRAETEIWCVPIDSPRALPPPAAAGLFLKSPVRIWDCFDQAWNANLQSPPPGGWLLLGSLYLAGQALAVLENTPHQHHLNDPAPGSSGV